HIPCCSADRGARQRADWSEHQTDEAAACSPCEGCVDPRFPGTVRLIPTAAARAIHATLPQSLTAFERLVQGVAQGLSHMKTRLRRDARLSTDLPRCNRRVSGVGEIRS